MEINYSKQILRIHTPLNTSEYYIVKMLQVCKQFRLHTVESYKNADMIICQNLCLHIKMICQRFYIIRIYTIIV